MPCIFKIQALRDSTVAMPLHNRNWGLSRDEVCQASSFQVSELFIIHIFVVVMFGFNHNMITLHKNNWCESEFSLTYEVYPLYEVEVFFAIIWMERWPIICSFADAADFLSNSSSLLIFQVQNMTIKAALLTWLLTPRCRYEQNPPIYQHLHLFL